MLVPAQFGNPLAMRIALYLLMMVVLIPYALLAAGFALLDRALTDGTLGSLVKFLLQVAVLLLDGGLLAVGAALLALLALAASDHWRWIGFACLCIAAVVSCALIVFLPEALPDAGQWLFLAPCLLVAVLGAWLVRVELHDRSSGSSPAMGPGSKERLS